MSQHMDKISKKLERLITGEMEKRTVGDQSKPDYLQKLVDMKRSGPHRENIWSHISHLILAHHGPSVALIGFTFYNLLKNSELSKRVVDEFGALKGSTLTNCMLETSRLYGAANVTRTVVGETELLGFTFQPGTTLFVSPASVQLDESVSGRCNRRYIPPQLSTTLIGGSTLMSQKQ